MKYKLEYIWLDGYEPVPNLRGKVLIEGSYVLSRSTGVNRLKGGSTELA